MADKFERIAAPDLPNPAPDERVHQISDPHIHLPALDGRAYEELLALLRRDLQLDSAIDLIPPSDGGFNQGIQAGRAAVNLTAGSPSPAQTQFALPHAWPHVHDAFIAVVIAGPVWPTFVSSDVFDISHGNIYLTASVSGSYIVNWFSKGH